MIILMQWNILEYIKIIIHTALAYYLSFKVGYYFLPISFLLVFNAMMRIFSLSHDCIHGSFSDSALLNKIFGSFFGYFLLGISFQKYKTFHLLHHKYLNTNLDPDKPIESINPTLFSAYLLHTMKRIFTLNIIFNHILYYTDIFNWSKNSIEYKRDHIAMLVFWFVLISGFYLSGYHVELFIIWILPMSLFTIIIELFGLIQHRSLIPASQDFARNVYGKKIKIELFMPTGINYHRSHHESPQVPWYLLSKKKNEKENDIQFRNILSNIFDFN